MNNIHPKRNRASAKGRMQRLAALALVMLCGLMMMGAVVKPNADFYFQDNAGVLSRQTKEFIMSQSPQLAAETGAQVVVLTVESLEGMAPADYGLNVIREWGIGAKDKNNGVLILLSTGDREVYVSVGQGLEGAINDAKAGRFIDDYAIDYYRENDFDTGTRELYAIVLSTVMREYGLEGLSGYEERAGASRDDIETILTMIVVVAIIGINAFTRAKGGGRGGRRGPGGFGGGFFGGGFSGGGFGGGGGGGFSGGGGSSGGGGAGRGF